MEWKTIQQIGIGFIIGFILGFILKKAFKVGLVLLLAFLLLQFFIHGKFSADALPSLEKVQQTASGILHKNSAIIDQVRNFFKINLAAAMGFFSGLIIGLFKG